MTSTYTAARLITTTLKTEEGTAEFKLNDIIENVENEDEQLSDAWEKWRKETGQKIRNNVNFSRYIEINNEAARENGKHPLSKNK